ncbi:hypothetical protein FSP39_018710 [Pinctada imbricata]|uniref:Double-stranded RNA-specific adenosine deaminase n=1 Tax=Pinctada imbricata TaxID=66713 RepID=A0AA88YKJ6_PINIB|nr:hypothetical protein FSP39_018710 [Pinctada imbricata]
MMAASLSAQIINFILSQGNGTCNLHDIVKGTRNDKRLINKELYKLRRQGAVEKVNDSPPVWSVCSHGGNESVRAFPKSNLRSKGAVTKKKWGTSRKPFAKPPNQELIPKIVSYLQSTDQAVRTIDLAKHCGFRTSTEINPTLYNLCRRNLIRQASHQPALWCRVRDDGSGFNTYNTGEEYGHDHVGSMDTEDVENQRDGFEATAQSFPHSSDFAEGLNISNNAHVGDWSDQPARDSTSNMNSVDVSSNDTRRNDSVNIAVKKIPVKSVSREEGTSSSSDIDRLLFAMLLCPNYKAKSFVIGTKMKPQENLKTVQNILEECLRRGFVDTNELLWMLTEEGEKYIKTKIEQDALPSAPRQNIAPPPARDLSKKFIGPPPTPFDIVKSGQSYSSGSAPGSYQGNISTLKNSSNVGAPRNLTGAGAMAPSSLPPPSAPGSYQPSTSKTSSIFGAGAMAPSSLPPSLAPGSYQPSTSINSSAMGYRTDNNRSPFSSSPSSLTSSSSDIPSLMSIDVKPPPSKPGAYCAPSFMQHEGYTSSPGSYSMNMPSRQSIQSTSLPSNSNSFTGQSQNNDYYTSMQTRGIDRNKGSSSTSFKPPPPPMELLSEKMKKTDISPPNSYSSPAGFSQPVCQSMMSTNQGSSIGHPQSKPSLGGGHSMPVVCETFANAGIQKLLNAAAKGFHQSKASSTGNSGTQMAQPSSGNFLQGQGQISMQSQGHYPNQPQSLPAMPSPAMTSLPSGPASIGISSESFAALSKNPVSALMEYAQSRKSVATIEVIRQSGPSHKPRFVMGAFIGGKQLSEVTCTNKKDGRKEAADKALRALIAAGQYKVDSAPSKPQIPASQMTHFDKMAALTHQAFNTLSVTIAESFSGRKVIAGLVMKTPQDPGTVIAIGTGNRCITGTELSLEGNTVNDSHAEIITRRGFIRFLYKQLLSYEPSKSQQMFVPSSSGKLRVRDGISFHLYISTAPCGDGALFSSRDAAATSAPPQNVKGMEHDPAFTSDVQGLLRTKIEGGEGTIPIEKDFVAQTFDGIQRGERLRTMSCSDKICRWNVVGLQGALLSHFIEPIYLESLTLGTLYDHRHLSRAVCCRVAKDGADVSGTLPSGYKLNHPWLGRVTVCEVPRETQKTKSLSLNWCYGDTKAEVTDGTKGLCFTSIEKTLFSRCSKRSLYDSFQQVCQKFSRQDLLDASNYNDAKLKANDFVSAKKVLFSKMAEYKYGPWVSKPVEEEMFS